MSTRLLYESDEIYREVGEQIYSTGFAATRLKVKDGPLIDVVLRLAPMGAGSHICTITDITEQKHSENTLRTMALALDNAFDATACVDSEGRITAANEAACAFIGYPREELLCMSIFDINPAVAEDKWREVWNMARERGRLFLETKYRKRDESLYPAEISARYLQHEGREFIIMTVRDLTKRKESEAALREGRNRYRTLFGNSPIAHTELDLSSSKLIIDRLTAGGVTDLDQYLEDHPDIGKDCLLRTRFIDVNKAALALFEVPDKEAFADTFFEFVKSMSPSAVREHLSPVLRRWGDGRERYVQKTNGKTICVYTKWWAVAGHEQMLDRVLTSDIDITKMKEEEQRRISLEDQLLHAQKMEAVGQLAGGIAHDFNNILSGILGYGNLLKDKLSEEDPRRSDVESIISSAERAAQLTSRLLTFSRKQVNAPRSADLNDIIRKAEQLLLRLLTEDIELTTAYEEGPLPVFADHGQMEQVLMNLATNARDAMPGGGHFSIKTERVVLSGVADLPVGRFALITVSDTGIGMSKETIERMFDPFYTTKEVGKGTGLGLSIVYGIIKQHDGEIRVTSKEGLGTTFRLYLPFTEIATKEENVAPLANPAGGNEMIMVVEDDKVTRTVTVAVLKHFGYRVIEAANGEEAIARYAELKDAVDLVILDVIMPRKNGRETYEVMKALKGDLKVLFVSGYTADIMEEKGVHEKDISFLSKPIVPKVLAARAREVLDS